MLREGTVYDATVTWWTANREWMVEITASAFATVRTRANDAFEALCHAREELEPQGWRLGVAGALANVWPSGMARDQGGGLRAYRMSEEQVGELIDTFEPTNPLIVVTLKDQCAEVDRLFAAMQRRSGSE